MNQVKYLFALFFLTAIIFIQQASGTAQTRELQVSQTVGELELVATFDGAMPAEVTVF